MATLRLVPSSGLPSSISTLEITAAETMVGREPGCDILLSDGSVSRKHAKIERRGDIWAVVDQGSANGTYVDSQKIGEAVLKNGQELRFGTVAFRVELPEELEVTVAGREPDATVLAAPAPVAAKPSGPRPFPEASPPPSAAPHPRPERGRGQGAVPRRGSARVRPRSPDVGAASGEERPRALLLDRHRMLRLPSPRGAARRRPPRRAGVRHPGSRGGGADDPATGQGRRPGRGLRRARFHPEGGDEPRRVRGARGGAPRAQELRRLHVPEPLDHQRARRPRRHPHSRGGGRAEPVTIELRKEGAAWKITRIKFEG